MKTKLRRVTAESPLIRKYRELLGVGSTATPEELKKSYRRLVVLYHPDKNRHEETQAQFLKITEAYEALSDADQVEKLNQKYIDKKLFDQCIEGLNISFGSFFGYRQYRYKRVARASRLGKERAGEKDEDLGVFNLAGSDDSQSILDNAAFDSIELVYAGKFSLGDEERIMAGFKGSEFGQLPWVLLNNRGIFQFLDEKYEESLASYAELNKRIPRNIIFMYRLGLCHCILAFKKKKKTLLGKVIPESIHLKKGISLLNACISLAENRPIGKQKCLLIRKTLAEIYEKAGQQKLARKTWQDIYDIQPRSEEARSKLRGMGLTLIKGI